MTNRIPCLILAFESNIGAGRNMETYYRALKDSKMLFPVIIYTDFYAYTHAPSWIKNKTLYDIPKNTHDAEDCNPQYCTITPKKHRTQHQWNTDCLYYIVRLRQLFGERTLWIIDTTYPELEPYMGRYIIQVSHTELFDLYTYFDAVSVRNFTRYWLLILPGRLLKNLVLKHCHITKYDKRFRLIGRLLDDEFYNGSLHKTKIMTTYRLNARRKTILYAPTWESKKIWAIGEDSEDLQNLETFLTFLKTLGVNVILRPHPISIHHYHVKARYLSIANKYSNVYFDDSTHSNIHGPNKSLYVADILITDLSSIAIDFLALNKPVIFIYPSRNRDHWTRLPSFRKVHAISYAVKSFPQLYLTIRTLLLLPETNLRIKQRNTLASYALASCNGTSGKQLREQIEKEIKTMKFQDYLNIWFIVNSIKFFFLIVSQKNIALKKRYRYQQQL